MDDSSQRSRDDINSTRGFGKLSKKERKLMASKGGTASHQNDSSRNVNSPQASGTTDDDWDR